MKRYALVEFGKPLQEIESPDPVPTGTEVLIRVRRSGVCHSDLHIADGFFDMGEGKKMDVGPRMTLPQALGHEILGEVIAAGPQAVDAPIGKPCWCIHGLAAESVLPVTAIAKTTAAT